MHVLSLAIDPLHTVINSLPNKQLNEVTADEVVVDGVSLSCWVGQA